MRVAVDSDDAGIEMKRIVVEHLRSLGAEVEDLNVLGSRTVTSVTENDGPSFGQPTARLSPLHIRLGARYRY